MMAGQWQSFQGYIPNGAIRAGIDKDGSDIFVGRAVHNGEMLPAKVIPNHRIAYIAWGGREHGKSSFEILSKGHAEVIWHVCSSGDVPANALVIGRTFLGEPMYVGRVFHDGIVTPGKVHRSHCCCYIPYAGRELAFKEYEVLVLHRGFFSANSC